MKLSVCIATYNETANIHYALDSVIGWVDEVVIVDGGSTDDTVQKVRSYGEKVRVIETTNPPMFHINKQKALDAATGDWILQLDADEEITSELKEEILKITNFQFPNSNSGSIAYQIPRKNFFLGRPLMKGGIYPDYTVRLYKKGSVQFPCKDVHENVVPVQSTGYPHLHQATEGQSKVQSGWLGTLANPMNHYSDPTFVRYFARWKRYSKAEAKRVVEQARGVYKSPSSFLAWKVKFVATCIVVLPIVWFLRTYIRHKGFMDGWQGLVFHLMSAVRWWGIASNIIAS